MGPYSLIRLGFFFTLFFFFFSLMLILEARRHLCFVFYFCRLKCNDGERED